MRWSLICWLALIGWGNGIIRIVVVVVVVRWAFIQLWLRISSMKLLILCQLLLQCFGNVNQPNVLKVVVLDVSKGDFSKIRDVLGCCFDCGGVGCVSVPNLDLTFSGTNSEKVRGGRGQGAIR